MIFDELTPENWLFFAIKHYDNPTSVTYSDFEEDLNRIKYIKSLNNGPTSPRHVEIMKIEV